MNGAESVVRSLAAAGTELCFANPGTSEMQFVDALDRTRLIRCVLGLFEGVVTGAADGYARMAGKPAVTLLHLAPGFANGAANLHNARKARSPVSRSSRATTAALARQEVAMACWRAAPPAKTSCQLFSSHSKNSG